jgi:hypothetical protein
MRQVIHAGMPNEKYIKIALSGRLKIFKNGLYRGVPQIH